jgi:hypothetical protein
MVGGTAALFFQCRLLVRTYISVCCRVWTRMWAEPSSPTLLREPPAKLSATPKNLPECIHLSFLWHEQMQRVLRWAEHVKYSMSPWRRSAWADSSPTTSGSPLWRHHSLDGFANLWSGRRMPSPSGPLGCRALTTQTQTGQLTLRGHVEMLVIARSAAISRRQPAPSSCRMTSGRRRTEPEPDYRSRCPRGHAPDHCCRRQGDALNRGRAWLHRDDSPSLGAQPHHGGRQRRSL